MENCDAYYKKLPKIEREVIEDYLAANFLDVQRYLKQLEGLIPLTETKALYIIERVRDLLSKQEDLWLCRFDSTHLFPSKEPPQPAEEVAA